MPDTGFKSPDVSVNTVWTNPNNAFSSDDTRATADTSVDFQRYDFPDFSVPTGATIDGIEVTIEGNAAVNGDGLLISLSWNNGTNFTSNKSTTWVTGADQTKTFGGATDTWGRTWAASEFADANFELRGIMLAGGDIINVDHIQVKVYYTATTGSSVAVAPALLLMGVG